MQKKIKQAKKYLEWGKPNQAIAELRPTLNSNRIQKEFKWVPNHLMGIALSLQGEVESAIRYLKKAVKHGSDQAETFLMLSEHYNSLGKFEKAEKYGKEAVQLKDDFLKAWMNLGSVYRSQAKLEKALKCFHKVNQLDPTNADVAYRIGKIYRDLGNMDKAHQLFDFALKIDEDHARAFLEKADLYKNTGAYDKAKEYIKEAKERYGESTAANVAMADIYRHKGNYDKALSLYKDILENEDKHQHLVQINYALCLKEVNYFDESEKNYRQAIEKMPYGQNPISNYLMGLHYNPRNDKQFIFDEHNRLGKRFSLSQKPETVAPSDISEDKKLKVGFISGGFRRHPVGFMVIGGLEQFSDERFEVYCYTANNKHDFVTRRIHQKIDHWKSVVGYNPDVVANLIREDEIDILVDLTGHAQHCQLPAMVRKPAPVIVKWVGGLFNTTGIEAFDYLVSDWYETPKGGEKYYTEKLVRLPDDYISYVAPSYMPDVALLPAKKHGYITFGCFNNPTKVNEEVLKQWAKIMGSVRESRLYLKSKQYDTASFRKRIIQTMEEYGISGDRLRFAGLTSHESHLETYNEVDIALDPWPYSGGLTTCEALYMGVPVITMPGPTFAGRHSTTHLSNAGLEQWVTDSWEEYTEKAVALANDLDELAEWRSTLREQLLNSPVCDSKRFGAHLSVAFREIWKQWVEGHKNGIEDWQSHITVDPLSDEQINELTDGPDATPLITIEDKGRKDKVSIKDDEDVESQKTEELMIDTEELVENVKQNRKPNKNGADKVSVQSLDNEDYVVEIKDGITICVPDDLEVLTTYVMLEQEEWFEPELDFLRQYVQTGMHVIDAGACFGGYALPIANKVGENGRVVAFEPSVESRGYLEKSKIQNDFSQLEIVGRGLSSEAGPLPFQEEDTPELSRIHEEGEKEIQVTTIDAWWSFAGQPQVDVIKLDTNGMEVSTLKGGEELLAGAEPVIVASISEEENSFEKLQTQLSEQDYKVFEYIPGPGVLVAYELNASVDPYLMNVIGIHQSRVQEFKENGWIFDESLDVEAADVRGWKGYVEQMPWVKTKLEKWEEQVDTGQHDEYLRALSLACAAEQMEVSKEEPKSRSRKGAMVLEAAQKLIELFNSGNAGIAVAMTYVRVMSQLGKHTQAVEMMKQLMETANSGRDISVDLPFLPPLPEQDATDIQIDFPKWLTVRIVEGWIMLKDPTTYMAGEQDQQMMKALEGNPEVNTKIMNKVMLKFGDLTKKERSNVEVENRPVNQGIRIIGKNKNYKNTPSEVVQTQVSFDYLNEGKEVIFNIPKRELFRMKNIFIDHEYALPKGFKVSNDGVIVDIGGNIGTFALYANHWNTNAKIYCFEPNPQVHPLLEANTADFNNINRYHVALGKSDGDLTLFQHPVNTGATSTSHQIKNGDEVNVKVKASGNFLNKKGIKEIDVLKIDTEGAEIPILKGMGSLLNKTKIIMLEYHTEEDRRTIDSLLTDFCIYSSEIAMINGIGTVKYINKAFLK